MIIATDHFFQRMTQLLFAIFFGIVLGISIGRVSAADQTASSESVEDLLRAPATPSVESQLASSQQLLFCVSRNREPSLEKPGPRHCAHAYSDGDAAECRMILRKETSDKFVSRVEEPFDIGKNDALTWKRHPVQDVAVVVVTLPEGVVVRPFRLDQIPEASKTPKPPSGLGKDVWIPCYPAKLEADAFGFPVLRRGSLATPASPRASGGMVLVDVNTFGGDSGAPVVFSSGNQLTVVGLVTGMQRQTDRMSLPFEERTTHTPLGLAIVVPASVIRETIDLLPVKAL